MKVMNNSESLSHSINWTKSEVSNNKVGNSNGDQVFGILMPRSISQTTAVNINKPANEKALRTKDTVQTNICPSTKVRNSSRIIPSQ